MKRAFVAILVAGALVGSGCTTLRGNRDWKRGEEGLDHRLSRFSYIEEGKLIGLAVDVQPARYREDTPYFPLEVGVANKALQRLTVKRESFYLLDDQGNRYPMATLNEIRENYGQVQLDKRFDNFRGVLAARWPNYTLMPSNFFPGQGPASGVRIEQVELHRFSYFTDHLYFPHPETGVVGKRFELFMDTEELEDPVFVKFKVE